MSIKRFNGAGISGTKSIKLWDQTTTLNDFQSIATVIVPAGGLSTITFSNIPQNFTHLQLRWMAQSTVAASEDSMAMRFNQDTGSTNDYSWHLWFGNGSAQVTSSGSAQTSIYPWAIPGSTFLTGSFGANITDILDYTSTTKNKTTKTLAGYDNNSLGRIAVTSGGWYNATPQAINRIDLTNGGNWAANSQFSLYGIKVGS